MGTPWVLWKQKHRVTSTYSCLNAEENQKGVNHLLKCFEKKMVQVGGNVLHVEKYHYTIYICNLIHIPYGSFLCTTTYEFFLCMKFPILWLYECLLCTKPPTYPGPSYVLLHPFYIRWPGYIYTVSYVLNIQCPISTMRLTDCV